MLTFVDDFSRKVWVYILKSRDETFACFRQWKAMVETQIERKVKYLRSDNGTEFCSGEFEKYCRDAGIIRHYTTVGTPQQNGVAERMNRTLLERTRCMLSHAGLPQSLWAEAVTTACYLVNRSPSTAIDCKTPEEVWSGKTPQYDHLKVFGCPAYAHIRHNKLEPRALKCVFLGYGDEVKGYRLWCKDAKPPKVIVSIDVTFDEMAIITPTCRQLDEASTSGGASPGGGSEAERVAERVTFEVETPVTESTTVDSQ